MCYSQTDKRLPTLHSSTATPQKMILTISREGISLCRSNMNLPWRFCPDWPHNPSQSDVHRENFNAAEAVSEIDTSWWIVKVPDRKITAVFHTYIHGWELTRARRYQMKKTHREYTQETSPTSHTSKAFLGLFYFTFAYFWPFNRIQTWGYYSSMSWVVTAFRNPAAAGLFHSRRFFFEIPMTALGHPRA